MVAPCRQALQTRPKLRGEPCSPGAATSAHWRPEPAAPPGPATSPQPWRRPATVPGPTPSCSGPAHEEGHHRMPTLSAEATFSHPLEPAQQCRVSAQVYANGRPVCVPSTSQAQCSRSCHAMEMADQERHAVPAQCTRDAPGRLQRPPHTRQTPGVAGTVQACGGPAKALRMQRQGGDVSSGVDGSAELRVQHTSHGRHWECMLPGASTHHTAKMRLYLGLGRMSIRPPAPRLSPRQRKDTSCIA